MRQKSSEDLVPVSIYLPAALKKRIDEKAKDERRSLSSEIVVLLEKALQAGK